MTPPPAAAPADEIARLLAGRMMHEDVPEAVALLRTTPGIGFCEWEDESLLRRHLDVYADLCVVARNEWGRVVGVLIGGSFGLRGTISHVAVSPAYRRLGVAQHLVQQVIDAFRERGIRRLFLFVIDGNVPASGLWATTAFRPTIGETTLECDL